MSKLGAPDARFLRMAYDEAGFNEGGCPIGSVLAEGERLIARGRNQRVQQGDPIAHGEMDCLRKAGRQRSYRRMTLYTSLSPCMMCTGTILQFGIPRVVIGEDKNFTGNAELLRQRGVEVIIADDADCIALMARFIRERPDLWHEDIMESDWVHNLVVIDHPLVAHKLSLMRDKTTPSAQFRSLLREISLLLGYEVLRDLPTELRDIETPVGPMRAPFLTGKKLVLVPILRAGSGLLDGLLDLVPSARVGHVGLYRDPSTLAAVEYYCKLPDDIDERLTVVVDPMLATGNSAVAAISRIKDRGARSIRLVCLLAAPEGITTLAGAHPEVRVFTAAVEARLNDHGYIVPGLGDAGDRMYGTK